MPIYRYRCEQCNEVFEKIFTADEVNYSVLVSAECPRCSIPARRTFAGCSFSTAGPSSAGYLQEDVEEYREMHYYEKQKEWDKAAKAAEGVSEFARKKFIEKAKQQDST